MISAENYERFKDLMNENREWYFGDMSRDETRKYLQSEPNGTYLIRNTTEQPGHFVLTIKEAGIQNKYKILPSNGRYVIGKTDFESIEKIIEHFSRNILQKGKLEKTIPKPTYRVRSNYNAQCDIEMSVKVGDLVHFILKGDEELVLCRKDDDSAIGWLPLTILKQIMKNKPTAEMVLMKIARQLPYETKVSKSRRPSVFRNEEIIIHVNDPIKIVGTQNGMLRAVCYDRIGLVPINAVKLTDVINEI